MYFLITEGFFRFDSSLEIFIHFIGMVGNVEGSFRKV